MRKRASYPRHALRAWAAAEVLCHRMLVLKKNMFPLSAFSSLLLAGNSHGAHAFKERNRLLPDGSLSVHMTGSGMRFNI